MTSGKLCWKKPIKFRLSKQLKLVIWGMRKCSNGTCWNFCRRV